MFVMSVLVGILAGDLMSPARSGIVINEIMTSNGGALLDEAGETPDWIELFNAGSEPVDLDGFGLSDDPGRPFKWVFPPRIIVPGEYFLVYASGKDIRPVPVEPRDPRSVTGLAGWYRARTVDPSDSAHVRRVGDRVFLRRWTDASGRGNDLIQTNPGRQPAWIATDAGGGAVLFDGNDDQLRLPAVPAENSFSVIALMVPEAAHEVDSEGAWGAGGVSGQRYLLGAAHGGGVDAGFGLSVGTNGVSVYEHGAGYMPALAVLETRFAPSPEIVSVVYAGKQPSIAFRGRTVRSGAVSSREHVRMSTEIGAGPYGAFAGRLVELLIFSRALTEPEAREVEAFVAAANGLPLPGVYHASFALKAGEEAVFLTAPDGRTADFVPATQIPRNHSHGRARDDPEEWLLFAASTPGAPNDGAGYREVLGPPTFSHRAGYYPGPFLLELVQDNSGATIVFTLDGSEPTDNSSVYSQPIPVRDRSNDPNGLSLIPTGGGWRAPSAVVNKVTTVRARAIKPGGLPSSVITRTYLIQEGGAARYSLPVISLVCDPDDFFGPSRGIYVVGNSDPGNFWNRGREWERPVHVEFFEPDGTLGFGQDASVRIHGGTSRQFPQKSLRIYARTLDGTVPIEYPLFPDRPVGRYERFLLRMSGHDHQFTFMRDALMQGLARELNIDTQAYRPVIVFLNGEYWGLHNLRESLDEHYLASHYDVDPDRVDVLEGHASANEGDTVHYSAMLDFLRRNDIRSARNYETVGSQMEIGSFIDYRIAETFYYRWDIGNIRYWRPRDEGGRWRWFLFDTDVGFGGFASIDSPWTFNMLEYDTEPDGPWDRYPLNDHNNPTATYLLRRLLENASFRSEFVTRYADVLNSAFRTERMIPEIERMASVIEPEMAEHIRRWNRPASVSDWKNQVRALRLFARQRPRHAREHLREFFGLGADGLLTMRVSDPDRGTIRVNSMRIPVGSDHPWTGVYFQGTPIQLTAEPAAGSRFAGWSGILGVPDPDLRLTLHGDLSLTARFEADSTQDTPIRLSLDRVPSDGTRFRLRVRAKPGTRYALEEATRPIGSGDWRWMQSFTTDENGDAEIALSVDPSLAARYYRVGEEG